MYNKYIFSGSGPTGVDDIKAHSFFRGIDWGKLAKKEIPAPYKPFIMDELDTRNFSETFTEMSVVDKPCEPPPNHELSFRGKRCVHFCGANY